MRITQRAPQSCIQCRERKLRCSKTVPCINCSSRGIANQCYREPVILSYQTVPSINAGRVRRRDSSRRVQSNTIRSSPVTPTLQTYRNVSPLYEINDISADLAGSPVLASSLTAIETETPTHHDPARDSMVSGSSSNSQRKRIDIHHIPDEEGGLAIEAAMSLESLAWGNYRDQTQTQPNPPAPNSSTSFDMILHNLVNPHQARAILDFHKSHVAWMHNVLFMPLFMKECELFMSGEKNYDGSWLGLYSAVICVSLN